MSRSRAQDFEAKVTPMEKMEKKSQVFTYFHMSFYTFISHILIARNFKDLSKRIWSIFENGGLPNTYVRTAKTEGFEDT